MKVETRKLQTKVIGLKILADKMKTTLEGFSNRVTVAEDSISEFEDEMHKTRTTEETGKEL